MKTEQIQVKKVYGEDRISSIGTTYTMLIIQYTDENKRDQIKQTPIFTEQGKMIINQIEEYSTFLVTSEKKGGYYEWTSLTNLSL